MLDLSSLLSRSPVQFEDSLGAAHWLNLPDDVKFQVEDAMNQVESTLTYH